MLYKQERDTGEGDHQSPASGRRETSRAVVIVAGILVVEAVVQGQLIVPELCDEIPAFFHFWVDTTKDVPVDCMEGLVVPVETFYFVVVDKGGESGFRVDCGLKTVGDGDDVNRTHDLALQIKRVRVLGTSGAFNKLHRGKSIGLAVHLCVKRESSIIDVKVLVTIIYMLE
jgi:hypothetical protein